MFRGVQQGATFLHNCSSFISGALDSCHSAVNHYGDTFTPPDEKIPKMWSRCPLTAGYAWIF